MRRTLGLLASYPSTTLRVVPLPICDGEAKKGRRRRAALKRKAEARASEGGVGLVADEAHLLDPGALGDGEDFVDQLVAGVGIRLEVKLGDRVHRLGDVEILPETN